MSAYGRPINGRGLENRRGRALCRGAETQSGGAVFSTGSIAWAGAMAWNAYDNQIAHITENVVRRFAEETPFG